MNHHPTRAPTLVIDRTIRAPRHRVWATWTDPDLLHHWSCPAGMHIPEAAVDWQAGGAWEIVMVSDHDAGDRHVAFGTSRTSSPSIRPTTRGDSGRCGGPGNAAGRSARRLDHWSVA